MNQVLLGTLTLQPRRQLLADGRRLPLGRRALDILSVLAEAKGEIVTKDEILEAVWPGVIVEENAIQVHVAALRKALGDEAHRLTTVRGLGYRLDVPEQPAPSLEGKKEQNSVAVLPFANLTGDRDKDHVCDGIVRELVPHSRETAASRCPRGSRRSSIGIASPTFAPSRASSAWKRWSKAGSRPGRGACGWAPN